MDGIKDLVAGEFFTINGCDIYRLEEIIDIAPAFIFRDLQNGGKKQISSDSPEAKKYIRMLPQARENPDIKIKVNSAQAEKVIKTAASAISALKSAIRKSPYRGVYYKKKQPKRPWYAKIARKDITWQSTMFKTAEEAKAALDNKIKELGLPAMHDYRRSLAPAGRNTKPAAPPLISETGIKIGGTPPPKKRGCANPFPGVSFVPHNREKQWVGQICRTALKWQGFFATAEEARDAVEEQIKKHKLKPLRIFRKRQSAIANRQSTIDKVGDSPYPEDRELSPHDSPPGRISQGEIAKGAGASSQGDYASFIWDEKTWECMRCDHKMESKEQPAACEMCRSTAIRKKLVAK